MFLQKTYPSVSTRQGIYAHRFLQKLEPVTYRSGGLLLPRYNKPRGAKLEKSKLLVVFSLTAVAKWILIRMAVLAKLLKEFNSS